jgi:hypothetical protein
MYKQIEHFTSFNLVPGSPILDKYFQNYVILDKQLLRPLFWENRFSTISPNFLNFHFSQKQCCQHNPGFTGTGHKYPHKINLYYWYMYFYLQIKMIIQWLWAIWSHLHRYSGISRDLNELANLSRTDVHNMKVTVVISVMSKWDVTKSAIGQ